jgi:hypothetical protein
MISRVRSRNGGRCLVVNSVAEGIGDLCGSQGEGGFSAARAGAGDDQETLIRKR